MDRVPQNDVLERLSFMFTSQKKKKLMKVLPIMRKKVKVFINSKYFEVKVMETLNSPVLQLNSFNVVRRSVREAKVQAEAYEFSSKFPRVELGLEHRIKESDDLSIDYTNLGSLAQWEQADHHSCVGSDSRRNGLGRHFHRAPSPLNH